MSTAFQLEQKDLSLQEIQEPSNPNYSCYNTGGVEVEVGEFFYGLVRMIKPEYVFETGTHMGISSSFIAQALKDNKRGLLTTIEIENTHIKTAEERWRRLELWGWVICDKAYSLDYELEYDVDIMILDSEPEFRFKELLRFFHRLKQGGYVFIHDLHPHMHQIENLEHGFAWPYGKLPEDFKELVRSGALRPFHFKTPRGLTGFYKVSGADYRWEA